MTARSIHRRDLLTLSLAGIGIAWLVATNKKPSVHYTVPEVDLAAVKARNSSGRGIFQMQP
jgi:hypothetical protein